MTKLRTIVLSAALTLALPATSAMAAADGWGASYSFNAIAPASNHLLSAKTTLVPGRLPPSATGIGPLFIWPGLSNGKGDLIQTTLDAWGDNKGACGAATGQWCGETSIFGSFGQLSGTSAAFDPDDHITIEYKLGTDNNTWTQTMTSMKLGKVVSTYSRNSGPMLAGGFGFATEADADSYTIDTQYYLCTEFHLAAADPTWGPKSGGGNGAKFGATGTGSGPGTAKNLRTPDGGLTWLVDLITLPAMQPQGTQTPAPAINCTITSTGGTGGTGGASSTGGAGGISSTGGTGGKSGTAGAGGRGGAGGSGVAGGADGTAGSNSGVSGSTSGGANGTAGSGSGTAGAAAGGASGNAAGAASTAGGNSSGGHAGAPSATSGASGSVSTTGGGGTHGGVTGTGGANAAGTSATDDGNASSGCSCEIERKSSSGSWLLAGFGLLVAAATRRRRR
jgi:MYXO-CTERM domain-containing protein